ncbi:MAG: EamA family transporter [Chlamydiia bacterium]|nr:EamA family transporter [Chlamydiia bacterium]
MFFVFLMYALFASIFPIGKMTLSYTSPFFLTAIRMLLAGGILLTYQAFRYPQHFYLKREHIPLLLGITVFNVFITNSFEFWSLQYLSAGNTSLIYTLTLFFSMLLGYFFLDERMNKQKWLGLSIGLSGALPIFWNDFALSLPEILMAIAAFTAALGWVLVKLLRNHYDYPIIMLNGISFLGGGLISLTTSLLIEPWDPLPILSWTPFLLGLLYITLIHNVLCYHIYATSLNRFSVTFMSYAGITNPLFAAIIGWLLLGETVSLNFFIALLLVTLGLTLFSSEEQLKRKKAMSES